MLEELKRQRAELDARIAELEKRWEPEGGEWFVALNGEVTNGVSITGTASFGVERPTKELAERASAEMRTFNRLLAYRDEFCPDHVLGWDFGESKYFVAFNNIANEWVVDSVNKIKYPGIVYFPVKIAEELAEKLNNGTVVL